MAFAIAQERSANAFQGRDRLSALLPCISSYEAGKHNTTEPGMDMLLDAHGLQGALAVHERGKGGGGGTWFTAGRA